VWHVKATFDRLSTRRLTIPYTAIPAAVDGTILSAAYLNLLSANQAYLYAQSRGVNMPFMSFRTSTEHLGVEDVYWNLTHRLPYLHYKINCQDGSNTNYMAVFYGGILIAWNDGPTLGISGYYDLTSFAGLPRQEGAWVNAFAYDIHKTTPDIVTSGGQYYAVKIEHTSAPSTEPGVGASWTDMWNLLTLWQVGVRYQLYVAVDKPSHAAEITVDYLLEADSTSI
jgi:hypothetical protein